MKTANGRGLNEREDDGSKGSALLVVAIVVLMVGLVGLSLLQSLQSITRETQEEETAVQMHRIIHVLSSYYRQNSRIPCPADPNVADIDPPFGAERGSGATGTATGDCPFISQEDGIVPFRTLGLAEDDIRDGWGRYLTYHVNQFSSLSAAESADYIAAYPDVKIIDLCRINDVWVNPLGRHDTYYPQQALACCVDPAVSLQIKDARGTDVTGLPAVDLNRFAPQHVPAPASSIQPPYTLPNTPAMVLISHGRNGIGAYLGNGTHSRSPIGGASAGEIANASGDKGNTVFVQMPRTESPFSYFDDIIMFETLASLSAGESTNNGEGCSFAPGCPPVPEYFAVRGVSPAQLPGPYSNHLPRDLYGDTCP